MKVLALVSGGKDSCYSIHLCQQHGHEVVALGNLLPEDAAVDELDSFMYQTVGHQLVSAYAQCTGLPLLRKTIEGASACQALAYERTEGDEVEDLFLLLAYAKELYPQLEAVASGAIASDYQRLRVENVCARLGLVSLAYMWQQPQEDLLRGMIDCGMDAILVKVAAMGLDPHKHLGKSIAQMEPALHRLAELYGCNVCGEGGEYETLTLDCPVFTRGRIVLDEWEVVLHSPGAIASVGVLHPLAFHVEPKEPINDPAGTAPDGDSADVSWVPSDWQPSSVSSTSANSSADCRPEELEADVAVAVTSSTQHVHIVCRPTVLNCSGDDPITATTTAQTLHTVLATLEARMADLGLFWQQSVFVHMHLASMAHFGAANAAYCQHVPLFEPPSRACVEVPLPQSCPLLLDVLFVRPAANAAALHIPSTSTGEADATARNNSSAVARKVLHVQSVSSWAPSCIGPYSQATACNGLIHMAGQIPLDPASMSLKTADADSQTRQALRSCEAVATAMRSCMTKATLGLHVYIASSAGGVDSVRSAMEAELGFHSESGQRGQASADGGGEDGGNMKKAGAVVPHGPSVVYLTVPALPRGSLVEIQPVLLDVDRVSSTPTAPEFGSDADANHQHDSAAGGSEQTAATASSSACGIDAALQQREQHFAVRCTPSTSQPGFALITVHVDAEAAAMSAGQLAEGAVRLLTAAASEARMPLQSMSTLRCWYVTETCNGQDLDAALQCALQATWHAAGKPGDDAAVAATVPVLEIHSSVSKGPACMLLEALMYI